MVDKKIIELGEFELEVLVDDDGYVIPMSGMLDLSFEFSKNGNNIIYSGLLNKWIDANTGLPVEDENESK